MDGENEQGRETTSQGRHPKERKPYAQCLGFFSSIKNKRKEKKSEGTPPPKAKGEQYHPKKWGLMLTILFGDPSNQKDKNTFSQEREREGRHSRERTLCALHVYFIFSFTSTSQKEKEGEPAAKFQRQENLSFFWRYPDSFPSCALSKIMLCPGLLQQFFVFDSVEVAVTGQFLCETDTTKSVGGYVYIFSMCVWKVFRL